MSKTKTAVKKAPVKKAPAKKTTIVSATRNVDKAALEKAIASRTVVKPEADVKILDEYKYGIVRGVRFEFNKDGKPTRTVMEAEIKSDRDLANEPDTQKNIENELSRKISQKGFYLSDVESVDAAVDSTEATLDDLRHEIEYHGICEHKAAADLTRLISFLKFVRRFREWRFNNLEIDLDNLPKVMPVNDDEWEVQNGHYREVNSHCGHVQIRKVTMQEVPPQVIEQLAKLGIKPPEEKKALENKPTTKKK